MGLRGLNCFRATYSFEFQVEFKANGSSLMKHHAREKDRSVSGVITGFDLI